MATKVRDSNMELLRIVAMVLVMIVHADFRALHVPTVDETIIAPVSSMMRFLVESLSIISVTVFVLLSGWYGIKVRAGKLCEFVFQVFFFALACFAIALFTGHASLDVTAMRHLLLLEPFDYWFFKSYLIMYIFSPVVNAFLEKASKREVEVLLVLFFSVQTLWGWLSKGAGGFNYGYSGLSFIGLYMLARYVRLYPGWLSALNRNRYLLIYAAIALLNAVMAYVFIRTGHPKLEGMLRHYTYPLAIFQALCFMLYFTKISLRSKFINWVAVSCFAIYLVHSNMMIGNAFYDDFIRYWFENETTLLFILYTVALIIAVFWISILSDKVRLFIWQYVKRMAEGLIVKK